MKKVFLDKGIFSIVILVLLLFVSGKIVAQSGPKRPNIIFIMSDDHSYKAISAYNDRLIETPNIDKIAKQGVIFKKAFVTNSICAPSRAVILTGKYSHMNGLTDNMDEFNGNQETLPIILKEAGYNTAIVGKWHLKSQPVGFDYWNVLPGQGNYYNPKFIKQGKDTIYKGYVTNITTDLALNWINKNKENPFFIMIHQKAPHRNQMPPLKFLNLYNDRKFKMPKNFYDDYKNRLALKRNGIKMADNLAIDFDTKLKCDTCQVFEGQKLIPRAYKREVGRLSPEQKKIWDRAYQEDIKQFQELENKEQLVKWQYQRFMEDYLRCIKSIDDNVGRVLKYLKENNLSQNTLIVYTSDQGFYLGEHGLYDKRFMYEESFRTPMLLSYPEEIKGGQKINEFVLNLDIAPTLLDFANVSIPSEMQGESMKKLLLEDESKQWRKSVYYHYYETAYGLTAHYGIRTKRYKLIHFYDPIDSWELYDLKKDPKEMKNLYGMPKYAEKTDSLKSKLKELQLKYQDNSF